MPKHAVIRAVASELAKGRLTNEVLANRWEGWSAERIFAKIGIRQRPVAAEDECASDLAVAAARRLFATGQCDADQIDLLIFCTQSPDYLLPTTACLIQQRLQLPKSCMAFDLNQGCSGYVYGLAVAKGLLEAGIGQRALLLTGDTYSKYLDPNDRSVVTIFGDAGTATLLEAEDRSNGTPSLGPFIFGTDGSGAEHLILPQSGCRGLAKARGGNHENGQVNGHVSLFMDGPKIFEFTLKAVPELVESMLKATRLSAEEVDLFVFHQANRFMLEALRRKLRIPTERFIVEMENTGNTVSSTIPIALERGFAAKRIAPGMRLMLVGFGVGFSWGATIVRT